MPNCEICGQTATHKCRTCGKWLCNSQACARRAAGDELRQHPARAVRQIVTHPLETSRVAARILLPPTPGGRN